MKVTFGNHLPIKVQKLETLHNRLIQQETCMYVASSWLFADLQQLYVAPWNNLTQRKKTHKEVRDLLKLKNSLQEWWRTPL